MKPVLTVDLPSIGFLLRLQVTDQLFFWILTGLGLATGALMWAFSKPLDKIIARAKELAKAKTDDADALLDAAFYAMSSDL